MGGEWVWIQGWAAVTSIPKWSMARCRVESKGRRSLAPAFPPSPCNWVPPGVPTDQEPRAAVSLAWNEGDRLALCGLSQHGLWDPGRHVGYPARPSGFLPARSQRSTDRKLWVPLHLSPEGHFNIL